MASSSALTTPEFMWCQRSDRLYVTIKVADCAKPSVHIADDVLKFSEAGTGCRGTLRAASSWRSRAAST